MESIGFFWGLVGTYGRGLLKKEIPILQEFRHCGFGSTHRLHSSSFLGLPCKDPKSKP